ncbi:unnamed protein product [Haemonchus placei]|uniref:Saposin A-type domain-containing protein n=1 Tax=Haemonchus placei TaxID=6290 RepID=A0A0N4WZU4_HAEPC|nr:unnamed protein product [Haemonchus placei]
MLFILVLIFGVASVSSDRCSAIPPTLWCSSKDIIKECGFSEQCNRYKEAVRNQPINITVLMESLCPYCQRWFVNKLPAIFKNFNKFVNIEIVPYGNARVKNGSIDCQHGPEECYINRFESCVIDSMQDQSQYVPMIYCIQKQLKMRVPFVKGSQKCFRMLKVSDEIQRKIKQCEDSGLGDQLQMKAAELTEKVWPDRKRGVPWILVNGISLESSQGMSDYMPYLLCEW